MPFSCNTLRCVWISVSFATEHDSCSICNWFRKVYCRSLLFPLWKWYFYATAVTRWNRFGVKAICGSLLSNMAGKQNAAVRPNITRPEIIDAAPVIFCGGVVQCKTGAHRSLENYSNWNCILVVQPPGVWGWNPVHIKPSPKAKCCNEFYYCAGRECWIEKRYEQLKT